MCIRDRNFDCPYFSRGIKEFWSRWHISLSSWLRDYIYIPLGGNRVSKARHKLNVLATFLVSGLWHGANWSFVIWGGIHGLWNMISTKKAENVSLARRVPETLVTFCGVTLAWVCLLYTSSLLLLGKLFRQQLFHIHFDGVLPGSEGEICSQLQHIVLQNLSLIHI